MNFGNCRTPLRLIRAVTLKKKRAFVAALKRMNNKQLEHLSKILYNLGLGSLLPMAWGLFKSTSHLYLRGLFAVVLLLLCYNLLRLSVAVLGFDNKTEDEK